METKTLKSGHELKLEYGDFIEANKLKKVVARELLAVGIEFDKLPKLKKGQSFGDLDVDAKTVNTIKNLVMTLIASDAVEAQLFRCAARCTIDGKKIDMKLFEVDVDMRQDMMPALFEVLVLNLSLFFESLGSLFSTNSGAEPPDQPQA